MRGKRIVADAAFAVMVLYGSVWVYEAGNLVVMSALSGNAHISVPGLLPTGVIAVSGSPQMNPIVKPLQLAAVAGAMGFAWLAGKRWKMPLMRLAATVSIASCGASVYWESLPGLLESPTAHMLTFGLLTACLTVVAALREGRAHLSERPPL